MMRKYLIVIPIAFLLFTISLTTTNAQSDFLFNGYIKDLGMFYKPVDPIELTSDRTVDKLVLNQIHNRLNFRWFFSDNLTFDLEGRNRIYFGQMVREYPDYKDIIDIDKGYLDLSRVLISADGWFMHSALDRVWVDYTRGNLQVRVGRQRINWGMNLVWNPNDIFNTFSYFDFDYEERPGTDALKIQYYTGVTSSAQLVYKPGRSENNSALAGMYRFSRFNYDIQLLGGWVGKDYVLGSGWSGDIKGGGFRGEFSWFIPREENNGSYEALVASVSADYTLKNSVYIHGGLLYNSTGAKGKAGGRSFFDQNISAKMLSLARFNLFSQISYPVTPLLSGNMSAIINPLDGSAFIGPSFSYSLADNWEIMINSQLFFGSKESEYGDYGKAVFARIKWAF